MPDAALTRSDLRPFCNAQFDAKLRHLCLCFLGLALSSRSCDAAALASRLGVSPALVIEASKLCSLRSWSSTCAGFGSDRNSQTSGSRLSTRIRKGSSGDQLLSSIDGPYRDAAKFVLGVRFSVERFLPPVPLTGSFAPLSQGSLSFGRSPVVLEAFHN